MEVNGNMGCGCNKVINSSTSNSTTCKHRVPTELGSNSVKYTQAAELFMNRFSLNLLDFDTSRDYLLPYYTAILQYLNYRLTMLDCTDIKAMLCEVLDIFEEGADAICQNVDFKKVLKKIIDSRDFASIDCIISYIVHAHKTGGTKEYWEEADILYNLYTKKCLGGDATRWPDEHIVFENAVEWAKEVGVDIPECGVEHDRFVFAWTHAMTAIAMRLKFQYANLFDQESDDSGDCCNCNHGENTSDYESWVSNVYSNDEIYDRTNYERASSPWQISKDRLCDYYRHPSQKSDSGIENTTDEEVKPNTSTGNGINSGDGCGCMSKWEGYVIESDTDIKE